MVDWSFSSRVLTLTFGMMFFLYLFGPVDGWFLTGPNSKMETVAAGNKSRLEQDAGIFLWQDVGKESSLLTGLCIFFGEADGDGGVWACWRLVPHRSKLQIGKSQCKLATNHVWNRMLDFFSWQEVGKESSLLTGLCIFVWWGWRWDPTDNLHVFFGFLWACWRWVPHRSQNQNWEETFFLKDRAQYCTMNIILHAHLHRTRTTHISFKLVLQSR